MKKSSYDESEFCANALANYWVDIILSKPWDSYDSIKNSIKYMEKLKKSCPNNVFYEFWLDWAENEAKKRI